MSTNREPLDEPHLADRHDKYEHVEGPVRQHPLAGGVHVRHQGDAQPRHHELHRAQHHVHVQVAAQVIPRTGVRYTPWGGGARGR